VIDLLNEQLNKLYVQAGKISTTLKELLKPEDEEEVIAKIEEQSKGIRLEEEQEKKAMQLKKEKQLRKEKRELKKKIKTSKVKK